MADGKEASIIIKKIKKGGHAGHHGGAWKVAYADFVTAMMAFFLLLWLLQATAQSQKEGIAEYFTPTTGIRDAAGIGFKGGKTNTLEGVKQSETSPPSILIGRMPQGPTAQTLEQQAPTEATQDANLYEKGGQSSHMSEKGGKDVKPEKEKPESAEPDEEQTSQDAHVFEKAQSDIRKAIEEDPNFHDFKDNIIVEQAPEGLKISVVDDDKLPMFESRAATLTQAGERILRLLADVIKVMPNRISITGHTEATNYAEPGGLYTNWELTADRANAARRFLMTTNMEPTRVAQVTGRADQELLDPQLPTSPRNRRISIILLRNSYLKTLSSDTVAPQNLLTVPRPSDTLFKTSEVPPVDAIKPAPVKKPEIVPTTHAQKTNVPHQDFKLPVPLKHNIGDAPPGGQNPQDDDAVPQSLLGTGTPPKPTAPSGDAPKSTTPTTPPAPVSANPAGAQQKYVPGGVPVSPDFKLPQALRQSIGAGGGDSAGALAPPKASDGQ